MSEMLFWVTTLLPTKKATRTKANQPMMAFLRCRPLQQAIRAAKLCGGGGGRGSAPLPAVEGLSGSGSRWMMRVFIPRTSHLRPPGDRRESCVSGGGFLVVDVVIGRSRLRIEDSSQI